MAILKFCSKLVNDNLPNYFESFTPQFSAGHQHYNFRNPSRLLTYSRIKCQIHTHYNEKLRNYSIMFVCCSFLSII